MDNWDFFTPKQVELWAPTYNGLVGAPLCILSKMAKFGNQTLAKLMMISYSIFLFGKIPDSDSMSVMSRYDPLQWDAIFEPWATAPAPPPKTQMAGRRQFGTLKFHGHYNTRNVVSRDETNLERNHVAEDNIELSCSRLKSIWIDAGSKCAWLYDIIGNMEAVLGWQVSPAPFWHEQMWHSPLLMR